MMPGAKQHCALFRDRYAGLLHRCFQIGRLYFRTRCNVAQVDADTWDDADLQWVFVDRGAAHSKMPRRVHVSAAVVCHGKVHHRIALYVARVNERLFVRLPHAVNDWRMSRITRRPMIEISAQIHDSHCLLLAGPAGIAKTLAARSYREYTAR